MEVLGLKQSFRVLFLLVVVLCCSLDGILCQDCESKETCDQCIQELNCFWCTAANNAKSHCIPITNVGTCAAEHTENPEHYDRKVEDRPLSESEQISPQRIQLKLRRNEEFEIKFRYKQSDNYPVDLYYIMDLSNSMNSSKRQLADLGKDLANEMRRKTNNFVIGFGSFVDKLTLPFVNTHPEALKHPCVGCAAPYSFKNHLSLQPDAGLFSTRVKETELSGNLDTPEGGLDAIMQAMVCKDDIGWRKNARHLLVMSTDAVSHIAGDGKLGGVIEPNDANCHMQDNTYTKGLVYDYPSISHINYVARQNNINIIFAIVTQVKDPEHLTNHYKAMSSMIENSKTGTLDEDSKNVVKFISDIYDQIRDSVKITSDATKDVSVSITSTCPSFVNEACSNVKPGQTLDFKAVLKPLTCHRDAQLNKRTITIKPEGLQDSLVVELEVLCDCNCAANKKIAEPTCSAFGDLECGICRCNQGRFGEFCQCDRTQSKTTDPSACVKPGQNHTCSGRGKCFCGQCQCQNDVSGRYCECDDSFCLRDCDNDNGKCNCGVCVCNPGWTGENCKCSTNTKDCLAPGSNKECSGRGKCECGKCQCDADYLPPYCERSVDHKTRCDELRPCVECKANTNSTDCSEDCKRFNVTLVEELKEAPDNEVEKCRFVVDNYCGSRFEYLADGNNNYVVAGRKKVCWEPISLVVWIAGVIISVLLIGICTLIAWKVITTIHDKSEYAKFISERNLTQFGGENPLYKPGTSHFQNPAYLRASQRFSAMNAVKKNEKLSESMDSKPSTS